MSTIKEVAERAGVSVGTVSNVLTEAVPVSPELRERVLVAVKELDYQPNLIARSLKSRQSHMLGMVISDITNPFYPQVVRGAEDAALKHDYLLVTFNTDDRPERERQVLSVLRTRRVDGILLVVAPGSDVAAVKKMLAGNTPIVFLDRVPPGVQADAVQVDNILGSEMCVRHLVAMGHRRIGIILGYGGMSNSNERYQGYLNVLRENGIGADPALIREADFRVEGACRAAKELCLAAQRPSALFVINGLMGLGALRGLQELGLRCPEDVALAVFDDHPGAEVYRPRLTTVAQPAYEIGFRGAELLIGRLKPGASRDHTQIRLEPELKVRESTAGWPGPFRNAAQAEPVPVPAVS